MYSVATNNAFITDNILYDGTDFRRRVAGTGALFYFLNGGFQVRTAVTGIANSVVTGFGTVRFLVKSDGNIGINPDLADGTNVLYNLDMGGNSANVSGIRVSKGTTAQRPTNNDGVVRHNTSPDALEYADGSIWNILPKDTRASMTTGTTNGSGDLVITLPTAMSNDTYSATATAEGTTPYILTCSAKSTTQVTFRVFDAAGAAVTSTSVTINWKVTDY
jgi:hypothetical protein